MEDELKTIGAIHPRAKGLGFLASRDKWHQYHSTPSPAHRFNNVCKTDLAASHRPCQQAVFYCKS